MKWEQTVKVVRWRRVDQNLIAILPGRLCPFRECRFGVWDGTLNCRRDPRLPADLERGVCTQTQLYDPSMATFCLLHSPLVGPATWKSVYEELLGMGHDVEILVIGPLATRKGWRGVVDAVVTQVTGKDDAVFVAHSGAGTLLPTIVKQSEVQGSSMVFVDAVLPALDTDTPLMPVALLKHLSEIAEDGLLPPWSEWFGPDAMASLVPDPKMRELIEVELPRVPLRYFDDSVPPVRPWPSVRNGFVLLSDGYLDDADEAQHRGWPVVKLPGDHLDLVTKAPEVAQAVVQASL